MISIILCSGECKNVEIVKGSVIARSMREGWEGEALGDLQVSKIILYDTIVVNTRHVFVKTKLYSQMSENF